jgi:energy-converting hydrogenase Eha subunit H
MILLNILGLEDSTFYISLLSLIIWLIIIYNLIRSAVETKKQLWNQKQQINLLIKIVEKLEASDTEVEEIKKLNNEEAGSILKM